MWPIYPMWSRSLNEVSLILVVLDTSRLWLLGGPIPYSNLDRDCSRHRRWRAGTLFSHLLGGFTDRRLDSLIANSSK